MHLTLPLTTAALAIAAVPLFAGTAAAGTFKHYACRTPAGALTPAEGVSFQNQGAPSAYGADACLQGHHASVQLNAAVTHGTGQGMLMRYRQPAGMALRAARFWRSWRRGAQNASGTGVSGLFIRASHHTSAGGASTVELDNGIYASPGIQTAGNDRAPLDTANLISLPDLPAGTDEIRFEAACDGTGTPPGCASGASNATYYLLHGLEATLEETSDPSVSNVAGALVQGGTHRGRESASFDAADAGSGVYRSIVEVDGIERQVAVVDPNAGRCADAGADPASPYEFTAQVPCKTAKGVVVEYDTATLPDGAHSLRLLVEDAAGNRRTVAGPTAMTVDNHTAGAAPGPGDPGGGTAPGGAGATAAARGTANGIGASGRARITLSQQGRTRVTTRYGRRVELAGRLVDEHRDPIAGASVEVLTQTRLAGTSFHSETTVTTGRDGRFSYSPPVGPSRVVRFAYRAFDGERDFADTSDVDLRVRAGARLERRPHRVRNGSRVRFSGRLLGAPFPARGVLLDLQARVGDRWRTFAVARTDRRGAYRYAYRFTRTFRPTTYRFRARARADSSYPYELGLSNRVSVRVR